MKIIVDSREHWTHPNSADTHISDYFDRHGIEWEVRKLDVGDYAIEGKPNIAVDRKQSLEELSRNLTNKKDKSRFWNEVRRANKKGIKLVVLVEHGGKICCVSDVANWKSKYSPVNGRYLVNEILRVHMAYSVDFFFCSKRSTAKKIIEILQSYQH